MYHYSLPQLYERLNLADALVPRTYSSGQKIIQQGDAADGMYFIEEGEVRITMVTNNVEKEVNNSTLNKGSLLSHLTN